MKLLRDTALLILYGFFSLFCTPVDFFYVLAFLTITIFCLLNFFISDKRVLLILSFFCLAASLVIPPLLYFFPAAAYFLFRQKYYLTLGIYGFLVVWTFFPNETSYYSVFLIFFGLFLAFFLQKSTAAYEHLDILYKHTRDDITELNLRLAEKNHAILEKQDYEIYAATLRERNRIAREIHDNVGHLLSRSILQVGALRAVCQEPAVKEPLKTLSATLNSAMDSIRSSVHDLHDEAIDLEGAIQSLLADFTFCQVSFHYDMGREIPPQIKYSFISITKEALSNVMKHSRATRVELIMREHPALYQLCIEDNGSSGTPAEGGIGLINIRERVGTLKGTVQIQTNKGFKIFITIPKEM